MRTLNIFFLLLNVLVSYAIESQDARGLTPLDVSRIRQISTIAISPSGEMVAYTITAPADPLKENKAAEYELHVFKSATGETIPYVTEGSVGSIAFRPGHNSLTFLSKRDEDQHTELYEMQLDGGEAQSIFSFTSSLRSIRWSPDGRSIAFLAPAAPDKKNGGLDYKPLIYEEDLTPTKCYIGDLRNGSVREIALEGHISSVEWSPDGGRLALVAAPTPLVDDTYMKQNLHIVDASTLHVADQIDHTAKLGQYAWSPDGDRIAFIAGGDIHDPIDGRLFVYEAQSKKRVRLLEDLEGKFEEIQWIDTETIQFLASVGVESSIGRVTIRDKGLKVPFSIPGAVFQTVRRAGNGATALVGQSATHPNELFYLEPGATTPRRITDMNPWLSSKSLGVQQVLHYKAEDGTELEGIYIKPVGATEGLRYPVITVVHGGPESHYDNGWLTSYSLPGQAAAGRGIAVFYPNYRGSTGRGEAFAKSSQGDPAGKEFDDIVDGIDHLIEQGEIDPERVGVTGGSYGGYATAWLSTRYSERFAAGVMFVGVSNNISKWGTSDIPEEMFLVHSRKRIWDDYRFFLERSPIYHADKAKTPLLILHGEEDTRVDPGQSYELYRHIKTRTDTPVRLVLYPGEGHGNRRSAARLDYNIRMMRWFENFLKSSGPIPDPELALD